MSRLKVYDEALATWLYITKGTMGNPGSVWRASTGTPATGLGIDGDFYLRDENGDVYQKVSGSYSYVANILGQKASGQLFLSAAGGWPSVMNGCTLPYLEETTGSSVEYYTTMFTYGDTISQNWMVIMPSDWDLGNLTTHFYWMHPNTTTDFDVVWEIKSQSFGNGSPIDGAWESAVQVTDTGGVTDQVYKTPETGEFSAGSSRLVSIKISRLALDVSDTMQVEAKLLGAMISYGRV